MYEDDPNLIGHRLRALRGTRSLDSVAGQAGISKSHLSRLERGERQLNSRNLIEALADVLRLAPSDLVSIPFATQDPVTTEARAAVTAVEAALVDYRLGDPSDLQPHPWPELAAELHHLNTKLRPAADYAAFGLVLPRLITELHAVYNMDGKHRTDALVGLAECYHAAAKMTKSLGVRGLAQLAADRELTVAERLGRADWIAHAAWVKALVIGGVDRTRQLATAQRALRSIEGESLTPELMQASGMLHLTSALSYAATRNESDAWAHFGEAETLAERLPADVSSWGYTWFGRVNVGIWRVALAAELGHGAKVAELGRQVQIDLMPSKSRRAEYFAELGRGLASDRRTRGTAVEVLRKAEELAPQRIRTNPLVRATVVDLASQARRDAVGRELRGMAHRMGIPA